MIIDFEKFVANKFLKWVSAYLNLPKIKDNRDLIQPCISVLIEKGVFTIEELRAELRKNNIILHEKYYKIGGIQNDNRS